MTNLPLINGYIGKAFEALRRDYVVIGKRRLRGWHGWFALGLMTGIVVAVVLIANQSGGVTPSRADSTAPATPKNLTAFSRNASIALTWSANTEGDLAGYDIQWKPSSATTWTTISAVAKTATSYLKDGLTNETSYDFRIRAFDTSRNRSSWSAVVSAAPAVPKPAWKGTGTASFVPSLSLTNSYPFVDNVVVRVDWADLESTNQHVTGTNWSGPGWDAIDQALNDSRNFNVKLRIMAGASAPNWVKKLGHTPMSGTNPNTGETIDCSQSGGIAIYNPYDKKAACSTFFWTDPVLAEYEELIREVARRYDGHPRLVDVVDSGCMTLYAEPFYRAHRDSGSNQRLWDAGLNFTTDLACHERALKALGSAFRKTRISLAVNPWDVITADGVSPQWPPVADFATKWRGILGERLVLQNNGLGENEVCPPSTIPQFCFLDAADAPKGFQTEATARLGTLPQGLYQAIENGIAMGACFIEVHNFNGSDWASDPAKMKTYDAQLEAQCGETTADTVPPTISLSAPTSGATISGSVTVTANASDNVAVSYVNFRVDGSFVSKDATSPYEYVWDTTAVTDGSHTLDARAFDAAGNSTLSDPVTVTVANPPSTPIGLQATPGNDQVTLSWNANTEPDLNNYAIQWKQSSATSWTLISAIDKTLTSYTVTGLTNGTSYDFRIRARDTAGNISPWSEPISATPRGGLTGTYFDAIDFTAKKFVRIDPTINFDWADGAPDTSMDPDTFSIRWTGKVMPKTSELYTFFTQTDDGVRLWVDGKLLIDKWIDQPATEWSGTMKLVSGKLYDIKLEYYERGGKAVAKLLWSSKSTPKQIIPSENLFPQ
jgi:chitodextrinase